MDAVAAPDGRRVFVLEGAPLQRLKQPVDVGEQDFGSLGQLYRETGVEHIARRHALMDKARLATDVLGEVGEKRDRLVMDLALDVADARDVEGAALTHRLCRALWDDAELFLRLAGIDLDVELNAEIVLRFPDFGHLRAAVARDHTVVASSGSLAGS